MEDASIRCKCFKVKGEMPVMASINNLHERGWPSDVIECQLAHAERNSIKAAYNHAQHLPERRKMMQAWADYLDQLKASEGW